MDNKLKNGVDIGGHTNETLPLTAAHRASLVLFSLNALILGEYYYSVGT